MTHSNRETPCPVSAPQSPINPLKRKEPPEEREERESFTPPADALHPGSNLPKGEYETGRVICEVCGAGVSFRDEDTGGFTLKHWNDHRTTVSPSTSNGESGGYALDSALDLHSHPPAKRRRAKRTEEERIEYLRADPYVAQFEAYRVLCASCDKWIRLRPNSTYCSIPWDAHRKSCLAKKINSKNVYALEERNTLFSKDPDVRKFDAERVLCNMCDRWLSVNPEDHLQAVQKWLQHRAACQKTSSSAHYSTRNSNQNLSPSDPNAAGPSHRATSEPDDSPASPRILNLSSLQHSGHHTRPPHSENSPSSFHDLNPANYAPAHESRRRNAEQRAATLRADTLIGEVEPNRVFCSLCQKWVQLRQDSSYCAYPWLQHRGKCLARHQRRAQKAAEIAELKAKKHGVQVQDDIIMSDGEGASEDPESEEGVEVDSYVEEDRIRRRESKRTDRQHRPKSENHHHSYHQQHPQHQHHPHPQQQHRFVHPPPQKPPQPHHYHHHKRSGGATTTFPLTAVRSDGRSGNPGPSTTSVYRAGPLHSARIIRAWNMEVEEEGDADAEGDSYVEDEQQQPPSASTPRPLSTPRVPARRPWPVALADLDSPSGRRHFIFASVDYLFSTTYESFDDMSISTLLTYLNAAVPQDKHEDFDTSEVIKAVAAMQDKGRIRFEGDMLRMIE